MITNKLGKNEIIFNNCEHFPESIFGLITGTSDSQKALILINFLIGFCDLHQKYYSDFERLVIVCPSHKVPTYQIAMARLKNGYSNPIVNSSINMLILRDVFFKVHYNITSYSSAIKENIFEMKKKVVDVQCYEDPKTLPPPEKINQDRKKTLIIFDDCTIPKESNIEKYYLSGNSLGIECIFFTESFFQIQKQIRNQCNLFILFKTSLKNLKNIYGQMGAKNFKRFKDFKKYCEESWKSKDGYVIINKSNLQAMPNQNRSITLDGYNN